MKKYFGSRGFSHHLILPVLAVIAVAAIGVLTLKLSNAATDSYKNTFTVATYNIRATRLSKSSWDTKRANAILAYIKTVDIVGLQETQRQLVNVKAKDQINISDSSEDWLTENLTAAGYSRTTPTVSPRYGANKADNGEDRIIFWRNNAFTFIKQGNKTLSNNRNLPWVKLRENASGKEFYFANTHLTYGGSTSKYSSTRGKQIKEILGYIKTDMTDAPIIFVGDMNSRSGGKEDKLIQAGGFRDSYKTAKTKTNMKYGTALANFKGKLTGDINKKSSTHIDHIYVNNNVSVLRVKVVGQKGSDHIPVEADIAL